jgi:hypothetical protein
LVARFMPKQRYAVRHGHRQPLPDLTLAPLALHLIVRVGTRVPESVRFYPLPAEVFVVYPEWRGYDYILVGDQILVINPRTHEIVAILDA